MTNAFQSPVRAAIPGTIPARAVALALILGALPAAAAETLLVVVAADGHETRFGRDTLEALPQHEFSTETQWTWEEQSYRGPLLTDVMDLAGIADPATGAVITLVADDGYQARIDLGETAPYLTADYPIIATRINGAPFPLESNGPLWVMFPYDAHPELDITPVHDMTIWQLLQIVENGE